MNLLDFFIVNFIMTLLWIFYNSLSRRIETIMIFILTMVKTGWKESLYLFFLKVNSSIYKTYWLNLMIICTIRNQHKTKLLGIFFYFKANLSILLPSFFSLYISSWLAWYRKHWLMKIPWLASILNLIFNLQ